MQIKFLLRGSNSDEQDTTLEADPAPQILFITYKFDQLILFNIPLISSKINVKNNEIVVIRVEKYLLQQDLNNNNNNRLFNK